MIRVVCRTNLDNYKREIWPNQMVARPVVGDYVKSRSGRKLRVVEITHTANLTDASGFQTCGDPCLIVELNR